MKPFRQTTALAVTFLAAACSSGGGGVPAVGSPGPALVVERFLQAANANDLATMTQLFGTRDRTIDELDGRQKAEQRMYVLATLLRHDDYRILGQEAVPGRLRNATELQVRLRQGNREVVVPYVVVRKENGGWIIERIDIEQLTQTERGG